LLAKYRMKCRGVSGLPGLGLGPRASMLRSLQTSGLYGERGGSSLLLIICTQAYRLMLD
jgi:hypothetical protein